MALLIYCSSIEEANNILKAIFNVALSQYDGHILISNKQFTEDTICVSSKKYLQSLISNKISYLQEYDTFIDEISTVKKVSEDHDLEDLREDFFGSFEIWASSIAEQCKIEVQRNEGEIDNVVQYTQEIVPLIIKAVKLYPCWSGIMRKTFGFGEASASSARIESNFNQLKNRVFKNDNLPLRIDTFLEKIISYYKGDHLLIQNNIPLKKIYSTHAIPSNQSSDSDTKNQNKNAEYEKIDKILIDTITLNKNSSTNICNDTVSNNLDATLNESQQVNEEVSGILHPWLPYSNGNFPTGAHRCVQCSKAINLFGFSVKNVDSEKGYVGNIQLIDVMGTLTSTATKLFIKLPSYTKVNSCENMLCPNYMTVQKYPVLSFCAFDGDINVQEEIDKYFITEETVCIECPSRRKHTVNAKSHIFIELVSFPKELEASTSYRDIIKICNVPQNYANTVLWY
ncbi:hypothetical protein QTP88_010469 [Uroleucon formosanum]